MKSTKHMESWMWNMYRMPGPAQFPERKSGREVLFESRAKSADRRRV